MDNGDGFFELRERILENDYEPLPDKYSKEIKQLVKSMLEKDPQKRPNLNQILKHPLVLKRLNFVLNSNQYKEEFLKSIKINDNFFIDYSEPPGTVSEFGESKDKIAEFEQLLGNIDIELKKDKFSPIQHKAEDVEKFKIAYSNFIMMINPQRLMPKSIKNLFQKQIKPKLDDQDPLVAIEEVSEYGEETPTKVQDDTTFSKKVGDITK